MGCNINVDIYCSFINNGHEIKEAYGVKDGGYMKWTHGGMGRRKRISRQPNKAHDFSILVFYVLFESMKQ